MENRKFSFEFDEEKTILRFFYNREGKIKKIIIKCSFYKGDMRIELMNSETRELIETLLSHF